MKIEIQHTKTYGSFSKAELKENFTPVNTYIKKDERSQINNLNFHLKKLGKEEQLNPKQ